MKHLILFFIALSIFAKTNYEISEHKVPFQVDVIERSASSIQLSYDFLDAQSFEQSTYQSFANGENVEFEEVLVSTYDFIVKRSVNDIMKDGVVTEIKSLAKLVDVKYSEISEGLYKSVFKPNFYTKITSNVNFEFFNEEQLKDNFWFSEFLASKNIELPVKHCTVQYNNDFNNHFNHSRMSVCLYEVDKNTTLASANLMSFLRDGFLMGQVKKETISIMKKQLKAAPDLFK